MKIPVIIPYIASQAQGEELPLCIEGWRKHCKADVQIIVVGDWHPCLKDAADVETIQLPRVTEQTTGNCVKHLEFVRVIYNVLHRYPKAKQFVFTSDDTFAVADFGIEELAYPKCLGKMRRLQETGNTWVHDKNKTYEYLLAQGIDNPIDYSTHLPYLINARAWRKMIDNTGMDSESMVFEDVYYNMEYRGRVPVVLSDSDSIRGGVWRSNPNVDVIRSYFGAKTWINCNEYGFVPALRELLKEHYYGE